MCADSSKKDVFATLLDPACNMRYAVCRHPHDWKVRDFVHHSPQKCRKVLPCFHFMVETDAICLAAFDQSKRRGLLSSHTV